jgi:hypothetical protein
MGFVSNAGLGVLWVENGAPTLPKVTRATLLPRVRRENE